MTERSALLKEMDGLLANAKAYDCHEVTIELIEQAIMHQQISEDIAAGEAISRVPLSEGQHPSGSSAMAGDRVPKQTACENLTSPTERRGMGEVELSVPLAPEKAPNGGAGSRSNQGICAGMPTL